MDAASLPGKTPAPMFIDSRFKTASDDSQPLLSVTKVEIQPTSIKSHYNQNIELFNKSDKMKLKRFFHRSEGGGGGLFASSGGLPTVQHDSFRWLLPRAPQHRLVYKSGECNITRENINKRGQRYLADIFTTLIDIKWRWNLLIFALAFALSWFIFALIWWLICFSHGDLTNHNQPGWKACVANIHDFPTALLFSIETQQTIGYGFRYMNPHCVEAITVVMVQCILGMMIQALMTGLVFAKLSRPKKRAQTLMFSKSAVICERDSQLCLLFRVGDMRRSHLVEAQIRALFISKRTTKEGEILQHEHRDLPLSNGMGEGRLFLVWPVILEHKIDESSPLWEISGDDIQRRNFEIVIILEGIVESTGMTTQARTSYVPAEVLWGHRFERVVRYQRETGQYVVDYSKFDNVTQVETSHQSAKDRETNPGTPSHTSDESEEEIHCDILEQTDQSDERRESVAQSCDKVVDDTNEGKINRNEPVPQSSRRSSRVSSRRESRVNSVTALEAFNLTVNDLTVADPFTSRINSLCQIQESP